MKKEKDILFQIESEKTTVDFSTTVMDKIYSLETAKELSLSKLIQEETIDNVSANFLNQTVLKIEKSNQVFKPVILFGEKEKIISFIAFIGILIMSYLSQGGNKDIQEIAKSFTIPKFQVFHISPLLGISVLCFTILLFIDYTFSKRKIS